MARSPRLLMLGTLDSEAMCRILQVSIESGYHVDHAVAETLRVSGTGAGMRVWTLGEEMPQPDVVVHMNIKVIEPMFGALQAWERQGIPVLNSPRVGDATINKWSQQDRFEAAGIPHPYSELASFPEHVYQFAQHRGYPFIVKPANGSRAQGIVPVADYRHIRERVEPGMDGKTGYVVQQFVSFRNATGQVRDRKAVVVGGRIVTVMERIGPVGEVAASRNGAEESIALPTLRTEELKYLPAAAEALGMTWCSVDYWLTDDHAEGIMINEINGFPNLPPREAMPFAEAVVAVIGERLSLPSREAKSKRSRSTTSVTGTS